MSLGAHDEGDGGLAGLEYNAHTIGVIASPTWLTRVKILVEVRSVHASETNRFLNSGAFSSSPPAEILVRPFPMYVLSYVVPSPLKYGPILRSRILAP